MANFSKNKRATKQDAQEANEDADRQSYIQVQRGEVQRFLNESERSHFVCMANVHCWLMFPDDRSEIVLFKDPGALERVKFHHAMSLKEDFFCKRQAYQRDRIIAGGRKALREGRINQEQYDEIYALEKNEIPAPRRLAAV